MLQELRIIQLCTIEKVFYDIENEDQKCLKVKAINIQKIKLVQSSYPDLLCKIAGIFYSTGTAHA